VVKITGSVSATKRLSALASPKKVELVGRALFACGEKIKAEAQHLITLGSVSGKGHKPSAPGTPPHNDTGHLKNSIIVTQVGPLRVHVAATARYAAIHEFGGTINHPGGTAYFFRDGKPVFVGARNAAFWQLPHTKPHPIPMPARPFMAPAARAKRKEVVTLINKAINFATKKG
jgi:HK97 gp10 family phage protein